MTELDLLKQVRDDVPDPHPLVVAQARLSLLNANPARRPRRLLPTGRPRLLLAGGLALTLAGGFLAADVVSHDNSPVPGTVADASTFLAAAAAAAAATPDVTIRPGQYREVTSRTAYRIFFGPKKAHRATVWSEYVQWFTADPTARKHPQRTQEFAKVEFPTAADEVAAHRLAPYLFQHPKPELSVVTCLGIGITKDLPKDLLERPCTPGWSLPTAGFLAGLPRDPDALLTMLRKDPPRRALGVNGHKMPAMPADQTAFGRIASVLDSGLAPADLRAALLQAARRIPGLQLLDDVMTLDGRHGRAIAYTANGQRWVIIISATTGQSIGSAYISTEAGAALDRSNGYTAAKAGDIESATAVTTRITATAPRPK